MYDLKTCAALLSASLSVAAFAQSASNQPKAPSAQPNQFASEGVVFERFETTMRMHADGTGERDVHLLIRIQSEGAAKQFSVLAFAYASASETANVKFVRVHKPDGTVVDTPAADAIDMASAVSREAPLYSDLKEKHIPVRSLSVGDTLEYEVDTVISKAESPGQFWGVSHFTPPGTLVVLAEVLTLEVPKGKYVQVWSPNHKPAITEHDGLTTYTWDVAQLVPAPKTNDQSDSAKATPPKDPDEDPDGRKLPSVAWTTFHNWAEVGDWYRGLAVERAQPNDAIRSRADEITKDAATPDDQVRAIYAFVSSHTRYVGIDFGVGRYQPHAAAEVLANQYGDCKDKDTLLEALLRAKGFTTAPALIGAGITPVPEVPTPAVFNHVITTVNLPAGMIWLDSTPEVAPYRYLSAPIRDQQALVVPPAGPATLQRTPAVAPYPFANKFEAVATLDAEGKVTSHMTASYRTDDELIVRALARNIAPAEWDKASQYVSSNTGFGGTTSNSSFAHVDDLSSPIVMTYDYTRHPFGDWDNRRIVPLFPALEFTALASDTVAPTTDIELGAPRTLNAITRIRLPEGYRTDLPDPVHVKTDFATFDKTYRFDGKEITIERNIVVLKTKLPKENWKKYQAFTKDISLDSEAWIQLIQPAPVALSALTPKPGEPAKPASAGTGSKTIIVQASPPVGEQKPSAEPLATEPPPDDASTQQLIQFAAKQFSSRDWSGTEATLDKIKAKDPKKEFLWSMYAGVALMQGKKDEAKADFKKEIANYPDNSMVIGQLTALENTTGEGDSARQRLQSYLKLHPGDLRLSQMLASFQTRAGDNEGALKTLQTAAEQNPDNRPLQWQISEALLKLDRKDEAAAAAKSVLDGADDPYLLNNAAYTLSETGLDLPYAEEVSRRSIAKLEEKSAAVATDEVNSNAFAEANTLIAAWDTLGWILFREEKFEEAMPWIKAAWRNALHPEVGDHLGRIYEAMGRKDEALAAYRLARASIEGNNATAETSKDINESIERLTPPGSKSTTVGATALQETRTYRFARPEGLTGWGTFRLQLDTTGVIGLQQMSGDQKLSGALPAIKALKFPELVPPQSKAHLLRSGVVSCSSTSDCELVLVPNSSLRTEQP